jgi:type VII secretion protein EccB
LQTRREQVRAYRFTNRRMVSALLSGDPENQDLPMRRLGLAIFGSTMVAAIVFAAVGVYGIYNPGGGTLDANSLIIERETGARYVYVDNQLYPVLNFASARLALGVADPPQQTLSQASLRDHPRGAMIGIPGAPDALPAAGSMSGLPWSVCSAPTVSGATTTQLMVGHELPGGAALGESSLLVRSGDVDYLIWHNHRLQIQDPAVLAALQISSAQPVPVGAAVINAITAGPQLRAPTVDGLGQPSPHQVSGAAATIGDVFHSGDEYYVLLADGLAPINVVTARLLQAKVTTTPPEISANQVGQLRSQVRVEPAGWLTAMPKLREADPARAALCTTFHGGSDPDAQVTVEFFAQVPAAMPTSVPDAAGVTRNGVVTADKVAVDGGHGAIVQTLPVPGATAAGTTVYLITDEGVKYPMTTGTVDAKTALGYGDVTPVLVPAALLALLPTGPVLDASAARNFAVRVGAP